MTSPETRARVREVVDVAVRAGGLYLEDVEITPAGRRSVVRVTVDLADGPGGVDADALADVARAVSAAMDAADPIKGAYVLEVSTPGTDRPLTQARHFGRAVGRLVTLTTTRGEVRGRLTSAGDVLMIDVDGAQTDVALSDVTVGRVEVELTRTDEEGEI